MGRRVKRVPLDFDWPRNERWHGYLRPELPEELALAPCPDCTRGYSPHAEHLHNLWWGYAPFVPEDSGSTPFAPHIPAVWAVAERNVACAPWYYGTGVFAVSREAARLARLWNGRWCHHLNQADVDALAAADRLRDFTHTFSREAGWRRIEPPVVPTAAQVNEWSLSGFGHDALNAGFAIRARCEREGADVVCPTCHGHASVEERPGQRAEAEAWEEAWEPTEPPVGEGWQLWETVSEGSPVSPVFATAGELARWMAHGAVGFSRASSVEAALRFVREGWAPSFVATAERGLESGVEYTGRAEFQHNQGDT